MKNLRIVVVDDSPFSIALLTDVLNEKGFEVVGEAGSLEEVKAVITEKQPDLVTMDMTLPGTDGLECTRAIHEINENIKVIIVSSMMDEEIVKQARENHASGYIQKPVDADELETLIHRVMASDELYEELQAEYYDIFKEAFADGLNRMSKTIPTGVEKSSSEGIFKSQGLSVIIGIIGKVSGRMLLDLSFDTAEKLTAAMLKREAKSKDEVIAVIGEFANIIAGNACSMLNKKNKLLGLRVAPPSIMYGDSVNISAPNFPTSSAIISTNFGEVIINIGFKRGEEKWMQSI